MKTRLKFDVCCRICKLLDTCAPELVIALHNKEQSVRLGALSIMSSKLEGQMDDLIFILAAVTEREPNEIKINAELADAFAKGWREAELDGLFTVLVKLGVLSDADLANFIWVKVGDQRQ